MGRPIKKVPENFGDLVRKWEKKQLKLSQVLEECHMAESTFYRRLKEYRLMSKT